MNILFIGDIFGNPGRKVAKEMIRRLKKEREIDFFFANGENAAGGSGITYVVAQELYRTGVQGITLGNHTWSKKEVINFISSDKCIVRPANYPSELPGRGSTIIKSEKGEVGILNLMGRVYMDSIDCPFKAAEKEVAYLKNLVKTIVVDIHGEATSEKCALGWFLDGKVSCVLGTHTHVQTADEKILPYGTGYISDVGMTGPYEGIIGVKRDTVINKFITHMPARFEVAQGKAQFNAVYIEIDDKTGKTLNIERIFKILEV
ncbi:TIGR00282 family metallophosphoesterase [Herbivorax sp. ANBcel31]|uniref:TIGR00282 family metallophosphoesterase n=1 Tax=Herbivorax sp. ANBcel31 TaxID=3069754 RepID=UPI0027B0E387|nr:TIGR00282 family metallophosphoesterase [Herbivorax sp. ANBcel31]MDQ2085962.1 TIGR00282 family metallophosphoesterase [Herbivorax sp. ANBcel31]